VVAAAVILDPARPIDGLADSKKLTEKRREILFAQICDKALCWSLGRAEVAEIDAINILQASLLAMQRAVAGLAVAPGHALVDGNRLPKLACSARAIVGGDASEACISAASIIAKVHRDRIMILMGRRDPRWGWQCNKGYGTTAHRAALDRWGPTSSHRLSFSWTSVRA